MSQRIEYRAALITELPQIAELIHRAFEGYPVFENAIAQKKVKRNDFLYAIHELNVKTYMEKQNCFVCLVDGVIAATALLKSPDKPEPNLWEYLRMGGLSLLLRYPRESIQLLSLLEKTTGHCTKYEGRSWFLDVLAVVPEMHHKGIGSKMINDCMKPYISANGGGHLTLNTNTENNRLFYKRNGFDEFLSEKINYKKWNMGNWCYRMVVEP